MKRTNCQIIQVFFMYILHHLQYTYLFILLILQIECNSLNHSSLKELYYSINEESEIGSYIGNLKLDSERKFFITPNDGDKAESMLTTPTFELYDDTNKKLFRIEETSGKLFVASRIDRETICPQPDISPDGLDRILSLGDTSSSPSTPSLKEECQVHLTVCISRVHWINVIITIHDINDHAPFFPISSLVTPGEANKLIYIVNVSESVSSGYEVPLMIAKDPDEGVNSVQSYSLRGSEFDSTLFSLSYRPPYSLNLVILGELDAEVKNVYTGELIACDGGQVIPKCSNQPFQLHITDVNDNKPTFNQTVYDVEISEDIPINSTIIKLTAVDSDSSQNNELSYKFGRPLSQSSQEHFIIDGNSGEITLKRLLNAKENTIFLLPVLAFDSGSVPLVGQTMVRITVKDTNDHNPWIEIRSNYEANFHKSMANNTQNEANSNSTEVQLSLNENQPAGTNIGLIISGDEDIGENSAVTCRLQSNVKDFNLEHANSAKGREIYRLSTNKSFDRETVFNGVIRITIICADSGKPSRTTEQKILLNILDINEYRPEFTEQKRFIDYTMPEDQPLGTVVMQIQASDADSTPEIQYHMSREAQSYFHIDADTGIITTRAVLDRETMPQIRFLVYATDNYSSEPFQGSDAVTANVTVHLTDKNDNSPELIGTKTFQVVENRPGFSDLVGQLTSIDQDSGNNATVHYKLLSVSNSKNNRASSELFMINGESGKIFATKKLDREENSQYELTVLLYDLGTPVQRSSTATIIINVMDENDNPPQWVIFYRFLRKLNEFTLFSIVSKSGELIAGPGSKGIGLTESGIYELYIRVCDNGNPPLDSNARLFLQVHQSLSSVYSDKYGEKGLFGYILSSGHLGIMLIVVILLVMCLTSICLIIAFISIRRRSTQRQLRASSRKASKYDKNSFPLQLNDELIMEGNMNLDGTIGNYGKLYHSPIMNAMCGAEDRMRSSRTDSDKSSSALVSSEFPCPINHYSEERTIMNGDLTSPHEFKSPLRNISKADGTGNNNTNVNTYTEKCFIHTSNQSELSEQLRMNIAVSEVDGGSADSGQGASEEEPVNHDSTKLRSKYARPYNSKELLLNKTQCSPIPSSNDCLFDSPSWKKGNRYSINESNLCTQTALPSINTFTHQKPLENKQFSLTLHSVTSSDSQRQSPIVSDTLQPRWRKPLFSNVDLGHHNHLFDEPPLRKTSIGKQSSTLPLGTKPSIINNVKFIEDIEHNRRKDIMLTNSHIVMDH
ncbi:unnamed protein product [Heterobilharzia americana]|nr:unnamed protein product [Heterobilharzia americana]